MCENLPTIFRRKLRRARKEYKCYECGAAIAGGTQYTEHRGLWDGSWDSYRICMECDGALDKAQRAEPDFCWEYGRLHECIAEATENDLLKMGPNG